MACCGNEDICDGCMKRSEPCSSCSASKFKLNSFHLVKILQILVMVEVCFGQVTAWIKVKKVPLFLSATFNLFLFLTSLLTQHRHRCF